MRRAGRTGSERRLLAPVEVVSVEDGTFDSFYRSQYGPLLAVAWAVEGRRDLAEDIVQDTMLTVHERWAQVASYDKPGAYARRVLLNSLTSRGRTQTRERRAMQRAGAARDSHVDAEPPDTAFWAAVRSLPERQMQTLALRYVEDRTVGEIAEILDIAVGTVKVHLHRGRLAMFDLLVGDYGKDGL